MQIIIVQTTILLFQSYPLITQGRGVYRNIFFKNPHVLINSKFHKPLSQMTCNPALLYA